MSAAKEMSTDAAVGAVLSELNGNFTLKEYFKHGFDTTALFYFTPN